MKILSTLFIILFSFQCLICQEFAPIGSKWIVQLAEPFAPDWKGTLTNESIRDTIIKGYECKVMFKSESSIFNKIEGEYILCQKGDSIFHFINSLDSLNLVMKLNSQIGDSWVSFDQANNYESFGIERNYKYIVDSIGDLTTNSGVDLKIRYITEYSKEWIESDSLYKNPRKRKLIERLGFISALLPTNEGDGWEDSQYETEIRCYEDSVLGIVKLTNDDNCFITQNINFKDLKLSIFPNPASSYVKLKGFDNKIGFEVKILDAQGKMVFMSLDEYIVDLSELNKGLYYLQVKEKESVAVKKLIIID